MVPFTEIVSMWEDVSTVPIIVGAAQEKTTMPYIVMNVVQSNPVVIIPRGTPWTESLVQFTVSASTLAELSPITQQLQDRFHLVRGELIADMALMNSGEDYSKQPNLSGNRGWTSSLEFRIRH